MMCIPVKIIVFMEFCFLTTYLVCINVFELYYNDKSYVAQDLYLKNDTSCLKITSTVDEVYILDIMCVLFSFFVREFLLV